MKCPKSVKCCNIKAQKYLSDWAGVNISDVLTTLSPVEKRLFIVVPGDLLSAVQYRRHFLTSKLCVGKTALKRLVGQWSQLSLLDTLMYTTPSVRFDDIRYRYPVSALAFQHI